jgi:hypothetical protein
LRWFTHELAEIDQLLPLDCFLKKVRGIGTMLRQQGVGEGREENEFDTCGLLGEIKRATSTDSIKKLIAVCGVESMDKSCFLVDIHKFFSVCDHLSCQLQAHLEHAVSWIPEQRYSSCQRAGIQNAQVTAEHDQQAELIHPHEREQQKDQGGIADNCSATHKNTCELLRRDPMATNITEVEDKVAIESTFRVHHTHLIDTATADPWEGKRQATEVQAQTASLKHRRYAADDMQISSRKPIAEISASTRPSSARASLMRRYADTTTQSICHSTVSKVRECVREIEKYHELQVLLGMVKPSNLSEYLQTHGRKELRIPIYGKWVTLAQLQRAFSRVSLTLSDAETQVLMYEIADMARARTQAQANDARVSDSTQQLPSSAAESIEAELESSWTTHVYNPHNHTIQADAVRMFLVLLRRSWLIK